MYIYICTYIYIYIYMHIHMNTTVCAAVSVSPVPAAVTDSTCRKEASCVSCQNFAESANAYRGTSLMRKRTHP